MNDENNKGLSRRKFVTSVGAIGALAALPGKAEALTGRAAYTPLQILKAGPYLQSPSSSSMTIRWITNMPCLSWVAYGESAETLDQKQQVANLGLIQANNTVNVITLDNLKPGTTYYYKVCSKRIESFAPYKVIFGETYLSDIYSFRTIDPKAEQLSFLVFNDIHDRPESFPVLLKFNGNKQNDFVFLNGDMFNFQIDEDQIINNLLVPFGGLFTNTPFFLSRGNHETRGKFARQLPDYFHRKGSNFYFSMQYGSVYFIVLDSGEDKEDVNGEYYGMVDFDSYRLEQAAWLKKEIEKPAFKKAKHKVVFSHIPLYYSGTWHGTMHCREVWGDLFNKGKIDVLISGHTHVHGIHPAVPGEHNYPIVIGGGPLDHIRTIIKVNVDAKGLELAMIDDQGTSVGELHL